MLPSSLRMHLTNALLLRIERHLGLTCLKMFANSLFGWVQRTTTTTVLLKSPTLFRIERTVNLLPNKSALCCLPVIVSLEYNGLYGETSSHIILSSQNSSLYTILLILVSKYYLSPQQQQKMKVHSVAAFLFHSLLVFASFLWEPICAEVDDDNNNKEDSAEEAAAAAAAAAVAAASRSLHGHNNNEVSGSASVYEHVHVCSGQTSSSDWRPYSGGGGGTHVDVDTSYCGFCGQPIYVSSLTGTGFHWQTTGASSIYLATPYSFRIYLSAATNAFNLTPSFAKEKDYRVQWMVSFPNQAHFQVLIGHNAMKIFGKQYRSCCLIVALLFGDASRY